MKEKNYSIRLSQKMMEHLVKQAKALELLPSEYLRALIMKDMEEKARWQNL